ncbi:sentrin-specific protease 1-like [Convolutriloba macropyga]|uniref:sentrin-specific protease 1-like n=1 Tax=Convolutriloba macropyga TaxID=536237 RepID=UPI003F51E97F
MISKLTNGVLSLFGFSSSRPENKQSRKRPLDVLPIRSPPVKRPRMSLYPRKSRQRQRSLTALRPSVNVNNLNVPVKPVSEGFSYYKFAAPVEMLQTPSAYTPVVRQDNRFHQTPESTSTTRHIYATKPVSPKSQIPSFRPREINYQLKNFSSSPVCVIKHQSSPLHPTISTKTVQKPIVQHQVLQSRPHYNAISVNKLPSSSVPSVIDLDDDITCLDTDENQSSAQSMPPGAMTLISKDIQLYFTSKPCLDNAVAVNQYKHEIEALNRAKPHFQSSTQKFRESIFVNVDSQILAFNREPPILRVQFPEEEKKVFPDLTEDQNQEIDRIFGSGPADEVLVKEFVISITRKDIRTLIGLNWLNDEIINFYLNLIVDRNKKNEELPKCHTMNTFFYSRLFENGYKSVSRWTRRVDIFSMDYILVPVHLQVHWCLAVISFKSKSVLYYDSMGAPNDRCLETLADYVRQEHQDKKKTEISLDGWTIANAGEIPHQKNASDCGMFSLTFAEHVAAERPFNFDQKNMPYLRRKMAFEIVHKRILTC